VGVTVVAGFRALEGHGRKFCKSIEIYKSNKIMKKLDKWFKNVGVSVLGGFRALGQSFSF